MLDRLKNIGIYHIIDLKSLIQAKSSPKKTNESKEASRESHLQSNNRKQSRASPSIPKTRMSAETRRPNEPLPEIPDQESSAKSSLRMGRGSSQMSSNNYEVLHTTNSSSPTAIGVSNTHRYP